MIEILNDILYMMYRFLVYFTYHIMYASLKHYYSFAVTVVSFFIPRYSTFIIFIISILLLIVGFVNQYMKQYLKLEKIPCNSWFDCEEIRLFIVNTLMLCLILFWNRNYFFTFNNCMTSEEMRQEIKDTVQKIIELKRAKEEKLKEEKTTNIYERLKTFINRKTDKKKN